MATNPMPYTFGTATSAIPLSQLDTNFATPVTLGNTAVYLNNTYSSIGNLTLANVTITSGTVTITNVSVTTANVSGTANISTLVVTANASVAGNVTVSGNTVVTGNVTSATQILTGGTANGVVYLDTTKALTTGSALTFNGTNLSNTGTTIGPRFYGSGTGITEFMDSLGTTGMYVTGAGASPSNSIRFFSTGTSTLTIDSTSLYTASGINVGIGTSSPGSKLGIKGTSTTTNADIELKNSADIANYIFTGGSAHATTRWRNNLVLYVGGAQDMLFETNATERMRLDSSGNLGLGVTPSAWLSTYKAFQIASVGRSLAQTGAGAGDWTMAFNAIYSSANSRWDYAYTGDAAVRYSQTGSGIHAWYTSGSSAGTVGNLVPFTQAMTLDASGRLLLNRTSNNNNETLQVSGNANSLCSAFFANTTTGQSYGAYIAAGTNSTDYAFRIQNAAANTDYLKVTGDGNLLVGTTSQSASERFNATNSAANSQAIIANATSSSFNGDVVLVRAARNTTNSTFAAFSYYNDGAAAYKLRIWDSGNVVNTNNSYGAISDAKLKENIVDATPKLEKLNQVRVVNFNFIGDQQKQLGVVAQELEQIFPSMIDESPDKDAEGNDLGTTTKSVKYSVFVPMLIKAMQEQQAIIQSLTARITALEGA